MKRFARLLAVLPLFLLYVAPARADREIIKIGVIIPLSGGQTVFGVDAERAIRLLKETLPRSNKKYDYEFLVEDGRCGIGNSTINAAQKLINVEKVRFLVLGCSGEVMQAAPLADKSRVVAIAYAAGHPDIRNAGDYIFRTYIDLSKSIALMSDLLRRDISGKVAILTEETPFTLGIKAGLIKSLGDRVGITEDFPVDETDFKALLTKAKASKPSAYYLGTATPKAYQQLFIQIKQLGVTDPLFSYVSPGHNEVLQALGQSQNGVKYTDVPDNLTGSKEFEIFYADYLKKYPEGPSVPFMLRTSYDAVFSIIHAVEAVGPNSELVKNYLYTHSMSGAVGKVEFDEFGDVKDLNFVLKQIVNGKPQTL